MAERAVSVRLDDVALRALDELMRGGRSQSQAIRDALVIAVDRDWRMRALRESEAIAADPADRAEIEAIQDFFAER